MKIKLQNTKSAFKNCRLWFWSGHFKSGVLGGKNVVALSKLLEHIKEKSEKIIKMWIWKIILFIGAVGVYLYLDTLKPKRFPPGEQAKRTRKSEGKPLIGSLTRLSRHRSQMAAGHR
jgi:hypothetical protein